MAAYRYIARDLTGQRKEGLTRAASTTDVLTWLREQDFTPVSVKEISIGIKKTARKLWRKRIKSADLAAICWQLTAMVEGGITITSALEIIAEDIDNTQLQEVLQQILEKMKKGQTFSESVAQFPKVFSRLSYAIILAGESSGNLVKALHRLAEHYDNRDKIAKKLKAAITYPLFIFAFIVLMVIFIMAFIIPRFRTIFAQIGGQLPAFTQAFMGFYDAIYFNIHYILASMLLLILLSVLSYKKTKKGHYLFSKIVLALPLFGKIFRQAFIIIFCRTMSTLLAAGVPVLEVFDILAAMTNNDIIKDVVLRIRERIVEGSSVAVSMAEFNFFPNMVVKMVQTGEESGSLSKTLDRTAEYYERKTDSMIATIMALLEPSMIIVVGAIVLVIVLALYLPIFTMSDVVR